MRQCICCGTESMPLSSARRVSPAPFSSFTLPPTQLTETRRTSDAAYVKFPAAKVIASL